MSAPSRTVLRGAGDPCKKRFRCRGGCLESAADGWRCQPVGTPRHAVKMPGLAAVRYEAEKTDHLEMFAQGEWMEFEQDEPEYFPGEVGNDPHVRSKYALSHIWHEWDGMQDFVAEMKAKEEAGEIPYPRGAGANAVAEYVEAAQSYRSQLSHIPYTPKEADEW